MHEKLTIDQLMTSQNWDDSPTEELTKRMDVLTETVQKLKDDLEQWKPNLNIVLGAIPNLAYIQTQFDSCEDFFNEAKKMQKRKMNLHDTSNVLKITTLYACISEDEDGRQELISADYPDGKTYLLVTAHEKSLPTIQDFAKRAGSALGIKTKVLKFTCPTVMEN